MCVRVCEYGQGVGVWQGMIKQRHFFFTQTFVLAPRLIESGLVQNSGQKLEIIYLQIRRTDTQFVLQLTNSSVLHTKIVSFTLRCVLVGGPTVINAQSLLLNVVQGMAAACVGPK